MASSSSDPINAREIKCVKFAMEVSGALKTPVGVANAIADPAESTGGNNAAIDSILVVLRDLGFITP